MQEITFSALCARLEQLVSVGSPVSVIDVVCETGADPESIREAFRQLELRGGVELVGGNNRGWSLIRKRRS